MSILDSSSVIKTSGNVDKRHTLFYTIIMVFKWNEKKNEILRKERGIPFERVIIAIQEGHLLDVLEHPNKEKYGKQIILVVEIEGYAICIPASKEENGDFFLKTLFPSRKYTKRYNLERRDE